MSDLNLAPAIAELEALDREGTNVAAGAPVTALDSIEVAPRWRRTNLVDWYYPGVKLSSNPAAMARARIAIANEG